VSTELGELHLCRGSVVEIAKMGLKCLKEGCFVGEGGRRSLDPDLDGGKLGEDGGDPSSRITIEKTEGNLNLQLKGREGRVNRPGRQRERTLSATRRTKDCPRMEATVVTVCRANFARNECSSGLAAATAVKTIEEAWRRGDIGQGLKSRRGLWTMSWPKNAMECRGARPWEVFPTVAPRRAGGSLEGSLKAVRLPQFLEGDGDLLVLDLYWRQRTGVQGHWGVGLVFIAFWVVTRDVDLLLGVEGVLKSRAVEEFVSHGSRFTWGPVLLLASMQQEPKPRVREDKYRPLKCRYRRVCECFFGMPAVLGSFNLMSQLRVERQGKTRCWGCSTDLTEAMGRLCALVHAQLVRAQHADAAPGASESERLCQRSPSCAVHCHLI
ncbi:hypothetical protein POSPLADRAFT_1155186, partial [Postia placenta MAD-698-R-SB12]